MCYPERGRELGTELDSIEFYLVKKCVTPKGDENCQHFFYQLAITVLRNVLPRKGTRTLLSTHLNRSLNQVKKCVTPKGDENA